MIVDYEYKNGKLIVSCIGDNGNIQLKYFDWKRPEKFELTDEFDPNAHPKYRSWDGRKVKKVYTNNPNNNRYAIYEFLDSLPEKEQDEIFNYKEPNIYFCDIETEIVDSGFVEPKDATTKVLSIALVHKSKCLLLGLKPLHRNEVFSIQDEVNKRFEKFGTKFSVSYIDFSTYDSPEFSMLDYFFDKLVSKIPVLTGWNFVEYDWTFLTNRAKRIGVDFTKCSLTGKISGNATPTVSAFNARPASERGNGMKDDNSHLPYHRVIVDYMELFKKWDTSIKIRESYSLDFVAEKTFGGEGKVHFTGGLQNLYNNDYRQYLFYNLVDTVLVQMIHEKMKYINVMYAISALSRTRTLDALSALRVTEGLLRNDFRDKKNIILCRDYEESNSGDGTVLGGYVRDPNRGLNKWVACYDFASLYPTTQRQNNIAPENFKGIKDGSHLVFKGRRYEMDPNDIVVNAGTDQHGSGQLAVFNREFSVTCNKLTEIYNDRKKYKGQMLKAKDELKKLQNELAELTVKNML